ncbi:MAG: hypothetical protein AAB403_17145, partial [Planctomycetota bacterium]
KLRAMQVMRQMGESDAAEAQRLAQAEKETNSAKQSQFQQWPDTYGIDPKELSAFVEKTYVDRYPEMVEVLLKRWNSPPARPKAISGPQAHSSDKKKGIPLSLMKI